MIFGRFFDKKGHFSQKNWLPATGQNRAKKITPQKYEEHGHMYKSARPGLEGTKSRSLPGWLRIYFILSLFPPIHPSLSFIFLYSSSFFISINIWRSPLFVVFCTKFCVFGYFLASREKRPEANHKIPKIIKNDDFLTI